MKVSSMFNQPQPQRRYVPLVDAPMNTLSIEHPKTEIVKSKVLVIDAVKVTATEDIEGNFSFVVDAKFGKLQDGTQIEGISITANEDIEFEPNLKLSKLNSIIRRCGVLERYAEYFTSDPEIIINSYSLEVKKQYQFFEEFLDGVLIARDLF